MLDSSQPSVILVTSTEPEEGKTMLAVSLARAMASSGRRTLLIDCDLRKSSVQRITRTRSPTKLNDLLTSELTQEKFERALAYEKETGIYLLDADSTRRHAS